MTDTTHRARKRFGQNFLHDRYIIGKIIAAINPQPDDAVVEIGPGLGAITRPLLNQLNRLTVVELDRDLAARLRAEFPAPSKVVVIEADALKTDFAALTTQTHPLRVVGNLPYNISTPLMFHLLTFKQQIRDMHFMLQKEVVERLASAPNCKSYGKLSVMIQYHCQVAKLIDVPPGAFNPPPKVDSAVVRLIPKSPSLPANDIHHLDRLVSVCFQQRRKTLRNSVKVLLAGQPTPTDLGIDLARRPETLTVNEFVSLSNQLIAQS